MGLKDIARTLRGDTDMIDTPQGVTSTPPPDKKNASTDKTNKSKK